MLPRVIALKAFAQLRHHDDAEAIGAVREKGYWILRRCYRNISVSDNRVKGDRSRVIVHPLYIVLGHRARARAVLYI